VLDNLIQIIILMDVVYQDIQAAVQQVLGYGVTEAPVKVLLIVIVATAAAQQAAVVAASATSVDNKYIRGIAPVYA
jgi:hypothetical protein